VPKQQYNKAKTLKCWCIDLQRPKISQNVKSFGIVASMKRWRPRAVIEATRVMIFMIYKAKRIGTPRGHTTPYLKKK
jgi:hypothetical protein